MLPEIHTWWPHLSIEAKHSLIEHSHGEVPESVVGEIGEITGERPTPPVRLAQEDIDYIETQRESVD